MARLATSLAISALLALAAISGCSTDNGESEVDAGTVRTPKKDAGTTSSSSSGDVDSGVIEELDSGTGPDASTGDGGTILTCVDNDDAGGSEASAKGLPIVSDCDAAVTKTGIANGIIDKDFYKFTGNDEFGFGCLVYATASTTAASLELCMFVKCKTGDTDFQGCTKGTQATSAIGLKGCCVNSPGAVELDYNCTGTTDESGDFYLRVAPRVDKCIPYSITYGL